MSAEALAKADSGTRRLLLLGSCPTAEREGDSTVELTGILLGLAAAASQSVSYIFSRLFVIQRQHAITQLLVGAHLVMGVMSAVLLPFVWTADMPPIRNYIMPLAGSAGFYMAGQGGFFYLVKRTDSSRIAPLLGLKIVILAMIVVVFMGQPLTLAQWIAVLLCTGAAVMLNVSGERLPWRSTAWVLIVCTLYSLSDMNIAELVKSLAPLSRMRASVVGACMSYIACGIAGLALLPRAGGLKGLGEWRYMLLFALAWFASMIFLYACFATVGPLYGNLLQSTRGIISIVIGAWLARMGLEHIEQKAPKKVLALRIVAAILMCAAIWMFQAWASRA